MNTLVHMSEYDQIFDLKVVLGHCDLNAWFSDFALYLDTQLIYDQNILPSHLEYR